VFYRETRVITDNDDLSTSRRACKLTSTQIRQIVDHHNELREAEGASNMEKMVRKSAHVLCSGVNFVVYNG